MSADAIWLSAASTVLVAFVTGMWAWLSSRSQSRINVQNSVNDGFQKLISELQEEVVRREEIEARLRLTIASQDNLIYKLQMRVREFGRAVATLHNFIVMSGMTPPSYIIEEDDSQQ